MGRAYPYFNINFFRKFKLNTDNIYPPKKVPEDKVSVMEPDAITFTWREGAQAPQDFSSLQGKAVVHNNIAYFSYDYGVYSFTIHDNQWKKLPSCKYEHFGMAVIDGQLTTIGGWKGFSLSDPTNVLQSLSPGDLQWKEVLPPMPTKRAQSAAVTTQNHLVAVGGKDSVTRFLYNVEVLDVDNLQWSVAGGLPQFAHRPQMTLHNGQIYLSNDSTLLSCSIDALLKSCRPPSTSRKCGYSVWAKLADIPVAYGASIVILRGRLLAIGGNSGSIAKNPTAAIHSYSSATNSWAVIEQLPSPLSFILTAVLPSEIIVMGKHNDSNMTYVSRF